MASYSNTNIQRLQDKLQHIFEYIINTFNELPLFKNDRLRLSYFLNGSSAVLQITNLDIIDSNSHYSDNNDPKLRYSDTFCEVHYELYKSGRPTIVNIYNVESTLGSYTGQFLVYIQVLCAYLYGIQRLTLDNATHQRARAARGIYRLFKPYFKKNTNNNNTINNLRNNIPTTLKKRRYNMLVTKNISTLTNNEIDKVNTNILDILASVESTMILIIDENFKQNFLNQMRHNIVDRIHKLKDDTIWNKSELDTMYYICNDLLENKNKIINMIMNPNRNKNIIPQNKVYNKRHTIQTRRLINKRGKRPTINKRRK